MNRNKARFCDGCGAALGAPFPAPATDELKHVTVLFSDLEGSTELIAGHGPEEARLRLMPALRAMSDAVHAFGGTVNQVLGDGVMALFGVPLSQEDHALRACCAALRMHELAKLLYPPSRLRVGLASGTTLLSTSGVGVAGAHWAFGEIIHVASRLQGIAPPGTTICSAEAVRLAGTAVDAVPLGAQILRGLVGQQNLFELRGLHRDGLRFNAAVTRGLSTFTGREAELAALLRLAAAVQQGNSQNAALLVGEAGIGKSRLAWELTRILQPGTWRVLQAEAVSYGGNIPYLPIMRLLRSCFGLHERDLPDAAAVTVSAALDTLPAVSHLARVALLSLLDLPLSSDAANEWNGLVPLRRRDALRDGVGSLLRALAACGPLLVLVEDLHWADEESLSLLDAAAGVPGLLLVATSRPGLATGWSRIAPAQFTLAPLLGDSLARLAADVLDEVDAELRADVVERSGGNPFFLEEMARAAAQATRSMPEAANRLQAAIPATVLAVLAERIDRLRRDDKEMLQAASALGTRFPAATLHALFPGCPAGTLADGLNRLRDAGLLRAPASLDKAAPDGEHGFAHALVQEVAYAGLPGPRRRDLHASIVRAIESLYGGRLAEHAETLAYHAHRGELWDAAVQHGRRAGQRAASRSAYRDAAAFFEQAIHACERMQETPAVLAEHIDIRAELRNALFPTAGIARNLHHSQAAERLAQRLGDPRRLAWTTSFLARDLTLVGRPTEALAAAHRALGLGVSDSDHACITRCYVALAAYSQGDYRRTAAVLDALVHEVEAGDRLRSFNLPGPGAIYFRGWLAWALARIGEDDAAWHAAAGMLPLAVESDQPLARAITGLGQGFALAAAGRLEEARDTLEASLALCRTWGFYAWFTNVAACLGHVLSRLGRDADGVDLLLQATERTRSSGILVSHAHELAWLAEAHLTAGRVQDARRIAAEAIGVAQTHEERGNEALAACVLAEAMEQDGAGPYAVDGFRAALALAEACGMTPLLNRCRAGLERIRGSVVA